jgi:hypothetical protein
MQRRARRRRIWLAVSCAAGVVLAAVGGYFFVSSLLLQPDRQLSKDLPIIENLDAYRNADSIGFLRALEHEGLFTGETEDAL